MRQLAHTNFAMTTTNEYKFKPSELLIDAALDKLAAAAAKVLAFLIGEAPATDALSV